MMPFRIFPLLLLSLGACAQEGSDTAVRRGFRSENLFAGGTFGLALGTTTLVNLSPQIGYRFNRFLAAGAGVNFIYSAYKQRTVSGDPFRKESSTVAGLNGFGRVYPFRFAMLQLQPEMNYVSRREVFFQPERQRSSLGSSFVPSLLAGAGAVFPSGRSSMIISVFYDLLQREGNPYGTDPFLNFSYNFGLGGR